MAEIVIPDFVNTLARANQAAAQVNDVRQQNALAGYYRDNAQGLLAGDQNALAGLAQYDPQAAFGMQRQIQDDQQRAADRAEMRADRLDERNYQRGRDARMDTRQSRADDRADERWRMELEQYAATKSQAEREAEAAAIEQAVQQGLSIPDAATWDQFMTQNGQAQLVGQFDNRENIARGYMTIAEQLKGKSGQQFRPASQAEAGQYGAPAGQFGPDGRFYPINPPSGMVVETGPDGQVRVAQGSGVNANRPLTESQSKDAVYATRAEGALATLDPIANELTSRTSIVADKTPLGIGREVQTDQYQVARNAGDEFLQAILRKDTGAAITEQEQALYGKTYLPQPGDGEAILRQKVQARRRALEALKAGMPPAAILQQENALDASGSDRVTGTPQRLRFNPETGDFE